MIDILEYISMGNRFDYPEDIIRIVKICGDRGIKITPEQAENIWLCYSDNYCAGWLGMPDEDEPVFDIIIQYAKEYYGANK